ncbi:MAG: sensor histidine kinase [Terriglobia bacterium]
MLLARIRPYLSFIIFSGSLLILLVAGLFLYQWINRLSHLDRQHDQEDLVAGMVNLERGFSAELAEMVSSFRPVPRVHAGNSWGTYLFESYSQWRTTTRWPDLIHSVSIAIRSRDGKISFETFNPATGDFAPQSWPSSLTGFRQALQNDTFIHRFRLPFLPRGFASLMMDNHPVLAVPLFNLLPGQKTNVAAIERGPLDQTHPSLPPGPPGSPPTGPGSTSWPRNQFIRQAEFKLAGWCFLELDPGYLKAQVLPNLVQQYFGASGLAKYHVAVITGDPPQIVYASGPSLTAAGFSTYDAKITLFAPRMHFVFFGPNREARAREERLRRRVDVAEGRGVAPGPLVPSELRWRERVSADPHAWQLVARDKRGSLGVEVNAVRRRNLAIAFGTLLLLALSIGTLVMAAHRAAHLARRQMEFVAGISHELRTPLTVIESAAHNLAQGFVDEPGRVKQYGEAIQTEGRRLSSLIQQTLGYAALQSGRQHYEFRPVAVTEVLDRAWAAFAPAFEEAGWAVERDVSPDIPPVEADPLVLESAIKNLFSNALKYASQGKWLRITARTAHKLRRKEVVISVEDRGPGIDPGDLPHIFEPFYRGRKVIASSTSGAGLGLSLVAEHLQAHQGHVAAQNAKPKGARFILYLPSSG